MEKLLIIAILPILFVAYVTYHLYREKESNLVQIESFLNRITQSAMITRLSDQLQVERQFSFDFALRQLDQPGMQAQRQKTDSLLNHLKQRHDKVLSGFMEYVFLENMDSVRAKIDRRVYSPNQVMHFYSSAVFRFGTLNPAPLYNHEFLTGAHENLTVQRLLSEIITYQGIISANIYNILYTKQYMVETLLGTLPSYNIYESYEKELFAKADSTLLKRFISLKENGSLAPVQAYMQQLFTTFRFDDRYDFVQWKEISLKSIADLRQFQMVLLESAEDTIQEYYRVEQTSKTRTIVLLLLFIAVLLMLTVVVLTSITRSLKKLQAGAIKLSEGKTDIGVQPETDDAIGSLATSISAIEAKNKELAMAADSIGEGNFRVRVEPRSGEDLLGNAIVKMKEKLLHYTNDLKNSREEFVKLAEFMPQIVWTADGHGKMTYYNKKWYETTRLKAGGESQNWVAVVHPDDVGHVLASWYASVESGEPFEMEYRIKDKSTDRYRWFLGRALPILDESGQVVKWFGTTTDIHDQKLRNEKLEDLVAQRTLELSRSNEDLQQFAHVASHDLKEPLRKIRIFSNRLSEEYSQAIPEKGKIYLEKLYHSAERMGNLIDSILNYSIVNATEQQEEMIDLNLVMEGIVNDLELLILQKEAKVIYKDLPVIKGVAALVQQLFYNLVNNALKFSKTGSPTIVHITSSRMQAAAITKPFPGKRPGQYVGITVKDNGIGFNQEFAEKIFNVFSRLNKRETYEGTGLGLALCKKIVHRHKGLIYAESKEGDGAVFHIFLPE